MVIKPVSFHYTPNGAFPATILHKCSFKNNKIINLAAFLSSSIGNIDTRHAGDTGIVDVDFMSIAFSKYVSFNGNYGSAISAKLAEISVLQSTQVEFVNNSAPRGGAMALHSSSSLKLFPNSDIIKSCS